MATNNVYGTYVPPASGGGSYFKLADGESAKVRLTTEPYIFYKENQFDEDKPPATRYGWIVYNRDENKAQAMEQGVLFYKQIAKLAIDEDWGDPTEYDIKITRDGTGTDTRYYVNPVPKRDKLTSDQLKAAEALDPTKLFENSIPLSQVDGTTQPAVPDTIVQDLDDSQPISLDDIPF